MCNLYAMMKARAEAVQLALALGDLSNNRPPMPGIYPDYGAPIVLVQDGRRVMRDVRWGMPSSSNALYEAAKRRGDKLRAKGKAFDFNELLRLEPDKGTTNIRNVQSAHWKPYLGVAYRCLVPFTSFCEPDQKSGSLENTWFAFGEDRPLAFFAGFWKPQHTSVRKVKEGEITLDVFGFHTTEPNAEVAAVHPKAMPVILRTEAEREIWMTAPWEEAQQLRRPLPDGSLVVNNRGVKEDDPQGLATAPDLFR